MRWEALSSKQLDEAIKISKGLCVLPLGVVEKHGDHLPLGTDMYIGRTVAEKAAEIEPAVVFPYYFLGQIMEGAHYPGTIALQGDVIFHTLEAICDEIKRNGFDKILIVSSHGGNTAFLSFFIQTMLGKKKDYMVYVTSILSLQEEQVGQLQEQFGAIDLSTGKHAGLKETALMHAIAPELVDMDAQNPDVSASLNRDKELSAQDVTTGFSWFSKYPYHYAGSHIGAAAEIGKAVLEKNVKNLAEAIKAVKMDTSMTNLAADFYRDAKR